jgi:non-ribosomal peptide synthetase component F
VTEENVTPFMLFLTALAVAIRRFSGEDDILIGSPGANRAATELSSLIGSIATTLIFRVTVEGEPSFRELLRDVRELALRVYANQGLPVEQIADTVWPRRDPRIDPIPRVHLRVSDGPRVILTLPEMDATPLAIDTGRTRFDLELDLELGPHTIAGSLRFNRETFDPTTIARLTDELTEILRAALADPDAKLGSRA